MRRRNRMIKMIVLISVLSLVVITMATTIILAVVKKDFNVNLKNPTQIRIYDTAAGNFYGYTYDKGEDEYNEIMELFNNSSSASVLSLLFEGKLNKENYIENKNANHSVISNIIEKNPNYYYIEFIYDGLTPLMINDEAYYKTGTSEIVEYTKLLIEVKNVYEMTDVTIYVENYNKYSSSDTIASSYQIMTQADQTLLYAYIASLVD
ncbi:MAG: hypothetical protein IJW82_07985 [Clostridia bacterium]|nr:hypothetical protein [Clostridia bacterium]